MGLYSSVMEQKMVRKYSDRELFVRYIKRLAPYKKNIYLIAIFILISSIAEILNPLIVGFGVDELSRPNSNLFFIIILSLLYILFSATIWIMFFLRRRQYSKFVPYFLENLRMDIFDKLQEQDISFFDNYQSGALNTRVSNDALDFGDTTSLIAETAGNFLITLLTFTILALLNLLLALIALAAVPFVLLLMFSLRKLARIVSRSYRKAIENVNNAMVESVEGIHVSKSYGQESNISTQFNEINKDYFKTTFKLTAVTHLWRHLLNFIASITLLIILYVGGLSVIEGNMTTGVIFTFVLYLQGFFRPIIILATFFPQLSTGMAAYERIIEILDSEPRVKQNASEVKIKKLEGEIVFEDLSFFYRDNEWIFEDFNLRIEKGEKLAIVGHTGAGKTSLISLLARFYEFQKGEIKIDGINIRDITLDSFRRNVGIVQQDVFLFSGTLEENIRYGKPDATEEELWNAIRAVHAEEFIKYLPEGLKTQIGERGKGLSLGQKQIISFARALLSDPKILILDEATSSVDAYTEAVIQEALQELLSNRTSIIIAHRLSTVVNADRIIVMERGKIIEEGNHNSLLARNGKYAQLYRQYFEYQSLNWHIAHNNLKSE
ncbi:MAG: ABC transporter ATP-binding protein [Promethearchaeota archaeon]